MTTRPPPTACGRGARGRAAGRGGPPTAATAGRGPGALGGSPQPGVKKKIKLAAAQTVTPDTGFAAGQTVQIGAGTSAETLVVSSTSTAPSLTFKTKPAYDHASGVTVAQATTGAVGTLKVSGGLN